MPIQVIQKCSDTKFVALNMILNMMCTFDIVGALNLLKLKLHSFGSGWSFLKLASVSAVPGADGAGRSAPTGLLNSPSRNFRMASR